MQDADLENSRTESLAEIMDIGADDRRLWKADELAAVFKHQLSAPLEFDLSFLRPAPAPALRTLGSRPGPPIESFRDLLQHPDPPLELLESTKEFSKSARKRADGPLPDEISTMLYVLSIAAALVKCGRRITALDDRGLLRRLTWALDQPWVDKPTRGLLEEARRAVETVEPDSHA